MRQSKNICSVKFLNRAVVFNLTNYRPYILNETALLVLRLHKRRTSLNKIAKALSDRYQISCQQAISDAMRLVAELKKRGLR